MVHKKILGGYRTLEDAGSRERRFHSEAHTMQHFHRTVRAVSLDRYAGKGLDMVSLGFASTMDIQRSTGGFALY
jgi:hypothetical protein